MTTRRHVHRRVKVSPWRLLVPMLIGLGLLSWALELGRERPRPSAAAQSE